MYNLQITGNAIWEMLRHFVPSADHKRAQLAYALAEHVLDCPNFFDKMYSVEDGEQPELAAKAEAVLVALEVIVFLEKHR